MTISAQQMAHGGQLNGNAHVRAHMGRIPFLALHTLISVTPAIGPVAGGTAVTLIGTGFVLGATVTFDGIPATSVVVVNDTTITCVTPAHASGVTDVVVTIGILTATRINGFTYASDLAVAINEYCVEVGIQLGVTILQGGEEIHTLKNWPKIICVPISEDLNDSIQAGGSIAEGSGLFEHEIALRLVLIEWHIWQENITAAEASVEAMYIAINRASVKNDRQVTSIIGAQWLNDQESTIAHGGSYVVVTSKIGFRLIDNQKTPLLTPTSVAITAKFNGEDVC